MKIELDYDEQYYLEDAINSRLDDLRKENGAARRLKEDRHGFLGLRHYQARRYCGLRKLKERLRHG